ncbi:hypothetical protein [Bacillus sp. 123MFChir2]|uniref:hypothetical protein n=1 Tax=Bacillus sp. 123MFChir2 TaxID=1169144 RepID=UPI00035C897A|nr:hypothetical protein [Bacillus sp. 123MFChir2]
MSKLWITAYLIQWLILLALMIMVYRLIKIQSSIKNSLNNTDNNIQDFGPLLGSFLPDILDYTENTRFSGKYPDVVLFLAVGCPPCENLINSLYSQKSLFTNYNFITFLANQRMGETHKYINKLENLNLPTVSSEDFLQNNNIKLFPFYIILNESGMVVSKGSINDLNKLKKDLKKIKKDSTLAVSKVQ